MKVREHVRSTDSVIGYMNAGGRGIRLNDIFTPNPNTGIAKALLEIGSPKTKLVDHHIANLRQQNIERIVIAAGDQKEVYEYVQDMYADDISITATSNYDQLGTGGDLVEYVRTHDVGSPLLVQNVDTILDLNAHEFFGQFSVQQQLGATASIALTLNKGVPNEGAYLVGDHGRVLHSAEFARENDDVDQSGATYRGSSTGAVIINPNFLKRQVWRKSDGQLSLYSNCLRDSWRHGELYAHDNQRRFFRDVGTVATWLSSLSDPEIQSQLCYNDAYV